MNESNQYHSQNFQSAEDLHDLNKIMQAFGISNWKNLGPLESSHQDYLSLLISIDDKRYILRERPEGPQGEDIHFRYQFQQFLQQSGIPIPSFLTTPGGEPIVSIGEDSFEVQQQMHGEFFSTASLHSLEWVAAAGAMLGRIHQASRRYTGPQHRWPAEMHIGSMVQSYLNLARAQADASSIHAISAALSDWVDQWEAVLPAAMVAIGAGKNLPEFHIHGDYHALNLRFGTEGVSAVTGFEASRWEKRIFEVAYGLFYFSTLSWLPGSDETTPLVKRGFEPERARAFLQGYAEIYPPAPGEAALLTDALLLISPLATINGPLEDLFYAQAEDVDTTAIDNLMERLVWATAFPGWVSRIRSSLPDMWG